MADTTYTDEEGTEWDSREEWELEDLGQMCGYDSDEYMQYRTLLDR